MTIDRAPSIVEDNDVSAILQILDELLPETSNADAQFLNPTYDPNLTLSESGEVKLIFLHEGAGYRNTLGYFFFDDSLRQLSKNSIDVDSSGIVELSELIAAPVTEIGLLFDNVSLVGSGGTLTSGMTVPVGNEVTIQQGTNVGFFLIQNAFRRAGFIAGVDTSYSPRVFYSLDHLNPEAPPEATAASVNAFTGLARHVAMMFIDDQIILGFEDLDRTRQNSDNDFNDAVFYINATPDTAIENTNIATYQENAVAVPEPSTIWLLSIGLLLHFIQTRWLANRGHEGCL